MATPMGKNQFALWFTVRPDSFVVRALAEVYKTFSTRRYDLDSGVAAIFEDHTQVFDLNGEVSDMKAIDLEGWVVNLIVTLRGKWTSGYHTGLRLEIAQIQLVQPLWHS